MDTPRYILPAEWEPHEYVWLTPPHNVETWPGCFDQAAAQYAAFMEELAKATPIRTTEELGIPTNDSWIRDYGPIFCVRKSSSAHRGDRSIPPSPWEGAGGGQAILGKHAGGQPLEARPHPDPLPEGEGTGAAPPLLLHDFTFNGWGEKYEMPELDNAVPQRLAKALGLPVIQHDFVLEGGSIDVNGWGTVLTTEQCLLNKNRPRKCKPGTERAHIEAKLHETLGTSHVIWLPGGIAGDDTDGHIDDVARFIAPDTVAVVHAPQGHPDHAVTQRNYETLREAHDQNGQRLTLVELPTPDPIAYDFPPDRFGPGGREIIPASYANFLITNGHVFVPTFGQVADGFALKRIEQAMPGYRVVGVRCEWLVVGLGALHCLSMPQPG